MTAGGRPGSPAKWPTSPGARRHVCARCPARAEMWRAPAAGVSAWLCKGALLLSPGRSGVTCRSPPAPTSVYHEYSGLAGYVQPECWMTIEAEWLPASQHALVSLPLDKAARKPPTKASPAPLVSTILLASNLMIGYKVTMPLRATTVGSQPCVMTTCRFLVLPPFSFIGISERRVAMNSTLSVSQPQASAYARASVSLPKR
mmetsp:Transcript_58779/g.167267  ORF Transcript_58779/g.167267 Transcript_58779/m.167267 type:complete len:202 (+) Transcript_58779:145-750(+)